jgi:hypothetical protein
MQLRTHPKMKWEGFSNWPPSWAGSYGGADTFPMGEEGVMTGVEMNEAENTSPRHLILTMEHRGRRGSATPLRRRGRRYPSPLRNSQKLHRLGDKPNR